MAEPTARSPKGGLEMALLAAKVRREQAQASLAELMLGQQQRNLVELAPELAAATKLGRELRRAVDQVLQEHSIEGIVVADIQACFDRCSASLGRRMEDTNPQTDPPVGRRPAGVI